MCVFDVFWLCVCDDDIGLGATSGKECEPKRDKTEKQVHNKKTPIQFVFVKAGQRVRQSKLYITFLQQANLKRALRVSKRELKNKQYF